jgi:hypothetical protein
LSCEDIGLIRVYNPTNAFGPVATGCVSLTTGLTLSVHIARRGETPLHVTQILFMNLTDHQLPAHVSGRNILAMDRGYWGKELIEYLSPCGFQLLGTHNVSAHFHSHLAELELDRTKGSKEGAKSVYWAQKATG